MGNVEAIICMQLSQGPVLCAVCQRCPPNFNKISRLSVSASERQCLCHHTPNPKIVEPAAKIIRCSSCLLTTSLFLNQHK